MFPKTAAKVRAFFLVLASTSLRIGDAVSLAKSKVDGDKIMLSTGKTNQPVFLKLRQRRGGVERLRMRQLEVHLLDRSRQVGHSQGRLVRKENAADKIGL